MFDVIETDSRIQMRMPATFEAIEEADKLMTAYLTSRGVQVDLFAMRILLRESLLNAVLHGCGKDQNKAVHLEMEIGDGSVVLKVHDPGPGFAHDERKPDIDVLADGGRGLALMDIYSDEIMFNEFGNEVTLRKRLQDPAGANSN